MRLIQWASVLVCFTLLLAGCSKDRGIKAPDNFTVVPTDTPKDNVTAPKVPPPPGN